MFTQKCLTSLCVLAASSSVVLIFIVSSAQAEDPYGIVWSRQLGTNVGDYSYNVAVDANGSAFITGTTEGSLGGQNQGTTYVNDVFLAKYSSAGTLAWTRQLGTNSEDYGSAVAIDIYGNAFITGTTYGALGGGTNSGQGDVFLSKYNNSGTLGYTKQLGSSNADDYDGSHSVAVGSSGNVIITGMTTGSLGGPNQGVSDAFLAKYNDLGASGTLTWTKQLGTSSAEYSNAVTVDGSGNAFITGTTGGELGGANQGGDDVFLAKYNDSGTQVWKRQFGTSGADGSSSVALDTTGNIFISGSTSGALAGTNHGSYDAFLVKYNASGILQWKKQYGTSGEDYITGLTLDDDGSMFVSGITTGNMGGVNQGGYDVYLSKLDVSGTLLWTEQWGTSGDDRGCSVALDDDGNVFITGWTTGDMVGTNLGGADAFLIKLSPVPEPGSLAILAGIAVMGLLYWRRKAG
jgi:hypothetical protein